MPELTYTDIDTIKNDIRREEITFSHLPDELTDHVCCDVENEMQHGLDFDEAYRKVKQRMGPRRLREIQEETLYAVDTKYRYMKNLMKISGVAGTLLLGFAAAFKIEHWPLAGVMATLGAFSLAFIFMPSALMVLWKETHSSKRLFLYISGFLSTTLFIAGTLFKVQHWPLAGALLTFAAGMGVIFFVPSLLVSKLTDQESKQKHPVYISGAAGLIMYILGLLFKLQHWPLATFLLLIGVALITLLVFPWYAHLTWKNEGNISARFIFMVIGLVAVIVPSALVTLNLQRVYERSYYVHEADQQALYNYIFDRNQAFLNSNNGTSTDRVMSKIHSETRNMLGVINSVETNMIAKSAGISGNPAEIKGQINQTERGPEIQFTHLGNPFDYHPVTDFLLPGCTSRTVMDSRLKLYLDFLATLTPGGSRSALEKLLDPSVCLPGTDPDNNKMTLLAGLHSLGLLKNSILTAESLVLSSVSKKQPL